MVHLVILAYKPLNIRISADNGIHINYKQSFIGNCKPEPVERERERERVCVCVHDGGGVCVHGSGVGHVYVRLVVIDIICGIGTYYGDGCVLVLKHFFEGFVFFF